MLNWEKKTSQKRCIEMQTQIEPFLDWIDSSEDKTKNYSRKQWTINTKKSKQIFFSYTPIEWQFQNTKHENTLVGFFLCTFRFFLFAFYHVQVELGYKILGFDVCLRIRKFFVQFSFRVEHEWWDQVQVKNILCYDYFSTNTLKPICSMMVLVI